MHNTRRGAQASNVQKHELQLSIALLLKVEFVPSASLHKTNGREVVNAEGVRVEEGS